MNDDPLRQAEAHRYQRARRRLGLASNVVELAALVAIVAATGSIGGRWAVALLVVGTVRARPAVRGRRLPALARPRPLQTDAGGLAGRPVEGRGRRPRPGRDRGRRAARHPARRGRMVAAAGLACDRRVQRAPGGALARAPAADLPAQRADERGRARRRAVGDGSPCPGARARAATAQDGREDGGRKRDGRGPGADREDLRVRHPGRAGGGRGRGWCARPHPRGARPRARPPRAPRHLAAAHPFGRDARGGRRSACGPRSRRLRPTAPATSRRSRRPCSASRSARP